VRLAFSFAILDIRIKEDVPVLYLGEQDIRRAVSYEEIMGAVERALVIAESGDFEMPQRMHVHHEGNTLLYMPCFKSGVFGTKLLTLFPQNAAQNQPVIEGLMLLNDAQTGAPLALLNGAVLTALRTGGVGGVGIRHTTPPQAKTLGLVGAGVQGMEQLIFASKVRKLDRVTISDISSERLLAFTKKAKEVLPGVTVKASESPVDLLQASEIVITATSATEPVLPDCEGLIEGKSFIGIGSYKPDMREFPQAVFSKLDRVYIDTEHGLHESGDLVTPLKLGWVEPGQIMTLGSLLSSTKKRVVRAGETTLFKSVGMAMFDLVVAELIYQRALEQGLGQQIAY